MTPTTSAGLVKCRPVPRGGRIALVAPASPFDPSDLDAGVAELRRLGFEAVYDERVFEHQSFLAGSAQTRGQSLAEWWTNADVDAVLAIRGGYGSAHTLDALDAGAIRRTRTAFIGYSDVTVVHVFANQHAGLTSLHGPMVDGRLARGTDAYDPSSFLASLGTEPLGEFAPAGLEVFHAGEATGPIFGGTLTQLLSTFGTPFEFSPPKGHVLFLEDVGERPYRLHRMLTQWRMAGRFADAAAVVFGVMPRCDEPSGPTARDVIRECLHGFPGPILFGFPSGHTDQAPLITLPFGVSTRVAAGIRPALIVEEAAAE